MASPRGDIDDEEEISGTDKDDALDEDMEALRRACMITGTDLNDIKAASADAADASDAEGNSEDVDDIELVRSIRERFSIPQVDNPPIFMKPLRSIPPVTSDDEEDDFEILRPIQMRFSRYQSDAHKNKKNDHLHSSEWGTPNDLSVDICNSEDLGSGMLNSEGTHNVSQPLESFGGTGPGNQPSCSFEWHQPEARKLSPLPLKYSSFPKSGQMFIDTIKKNRSCQKFIRSKLIQIEARIEENKPVLV